MIYMTKKFAILLGNFLEFYDFTLFAYLLPIISPGFFPSKDLVDSLTIGYLFLAVGFFSRPLGAFILGYIGDHYGRKMAIIIAILLMSISTTAIGILPSSDHIGMCALFVLAFCRILQGISAGGEYSGAGLLLVENTKKQDQFINGAILTSSGLCGAFVAALVSAVVNTAFFPKESWRILFFIGGIIGFITLWFRVCLKEESPVKNNADLVGIASVFKHHGRALLCTIIFGALMNVPFQMVTGFINTYFTATGLYNKTSLMLVNAFVILFCAIVTIGFGLLSRRLNPIKMMTYASLGMALFSVPFFILIQLKSLFIFIVSEILLILLSQLFVAPAFAVMSDLFPYNVRYRGIAIGNCLGLAFLGGLTPYISSNLIKITGISWSPGFYLLIISTLGFCAVILSQKLSNNNLDSKLKTSR